MNQPVPGIWNPIQILDTPLGDSTVQVASWAQLATKDRWL
jgi:hypothetical protein